MTVVYDTVEEWQAACPWEIFHDRQTGASLPSPPEWEAFTTPETRVVIRHPEERGAFSANLVLTVERPEEPFAEISAYTEAMVANMSVTLTDLRVLSLDPYELWGVQGRRVLSAHRTGPYSVALEQYWFVRDGVATVLSGSCDVADHLGQSETFAFAAAGMSVATRLPHE
ncbi:hypothetical protein ACIBG8_23790 [Nonomuraea sp. NPDC050556]|uniref:hypothetical protein n=1 Tax=Nonomuraea sp. NPDC050556 TaxID=3364369 RepID=UPI0037BDB54F